MKIKKISKLALFPLAAMILTGCSGLADPSKEEAKPIDDGWDGDPISYANVDDVVDYNKPRLITRDESASKIIFPSKIILHYHNDDMAVKNRRFYTWVTGVDGEERKADHYTETDMDITIDFDLFPEYKDSPSFFFIIKVAGTWAGQSQDIEIPYENWQEKIEENNGLLELWTIPGEGNSVEVYGSEAETKFPKVKTAKFTSWKKIRCIADEVPLYYKLYAFDKNYLMGSPQEQIAKKQFNLFKQGTPTSNDFEIEFNYTAKINIQYVVETEYASNPGRIQKIIVTSENLYENERFEEFYTYTGDEADDLGCSYSPDETKFKLWAPTAALVYVKIYSNGTPKSLGGSDSARSYIMTYQPGGVWSCTIKGQDLNGSFYTYQVVNSGGTNETIDPYAKACGLNGIRGAIYDKTSVEANPENLSGWNALKSKWQNEERYTINSPQDMSIYEAHIRDLTMDESWNGTSKRGSYDAFCESGTNLSDYGHAEITTGFDHIKELGVKAVQIVPVFDNDNDERPEKMKFNWGYNPLNYNCVEGGYSSDPTDPLARIREYKNLIYKYATEGEDSTRIIMDVVYNHVSSATSSCFHKVMPKYYFRYDENWNFYDGSGCNNEVKTDATMMSKYIVDSLCWWAEEYQIKGFRFDLMGLIDSWTLRAAGKALHEIDPSIMLYGEGWTSGGYHGKYEEDYEGKLINGGSETALCYQQLYPTDTNVGVGAFNDTLRNAIKGSNDDGWNNNPYPQWGYISQGSGDVGGNAGLIGDGMMGVHTGKGGNPAQTINYVSCHDNYTLWDQLNYTLATKGYNNDHSPVNTGTPDTYDLVKATLGAHAEVMSSNGVAFIQGGEELYRTKAYDLNSPSYKEGREKGTIRPYPEYPHYVDPTVDPDAVIATDDVWMFDKVISHNSYKSDDSLNSFKWDRKISVNGADVTWANDMWKKMIQERKNMEHYSYSDIFETEGGTEYINSWNTYDGSSVMATWLNGSRDVTRQDKGYYFVFAGRDGGYLPIGINGCEIVYTNNDYGYSQVDGGLNLAPYTFICYRKGY